jgi:RimJ/RimL family protein N-acetyltransferase
MTVLAATSVGGIAALAAQAVRDSVKVERTHDMALVALIMGHPAIWPHIHEDGIEAPAPVDHEGFNWMLATLDSEIVGVFLVHAMTSVCYQMHTCILPEYWGKVSARAAQALLAWAFKETDCQKMVTNVPGYNRAALRFAIAGGMQQEGINRASYMRNGALVDQIMLGITKQEWK